MDVVLPIELSWECLLEYGQVYGHTRMPNATYICPPEFNLLPCRHNKYFKVLNSNNVEKRILGIIKQMSLQLKLHANIASPYDMHICMHRNVLMHFQIQIQIRIQFKFHENFRYSQPCVKRAFLYRFGRSFCRRKASISWIKRQQYVRVLCK